MGVALDTDILLDLMIQEALDEPKACEHSVHGNPAVGNRHGGEAKWYAQYFCPACGNTKGLMALCDPWKTFVHSGELLWCVVCRHQDAGPVFYKGEWIKI